MGDALLADTIRASNPRDNQGSTRLRWSIRRPYCPRSARRLNAVSSPSRGRADGHAEYLSRVLDTATTRTAALLRCCRTPSSKGVGQPDLRSAAVCLFIKDGSAAAEPSSQAAKALQADALEQLGYQAEFGPWRNFHLTGAIYAMGVAARLMRQQY